MKCASNMQCLQVESFGTSGGLTGHVTMSTTNAGLSHSDGHQYECLSLAMCAASHGYVNMLKLPAGVLKLSSAHKGPRVP